MKKTKVPLKIFPLSVKLFPQSTPQIYNTRITILSLFTKSKPVKLVHIPTCQTMKESRKIYSFPHLETIFLQILNMKNPNFQTIKKSKYSPPFKIQLHRLKITVQNSILFYFFFFPVGVLTVQIPNVKKTQFLIYNSTTQDN